VTRAESLNLHRVQRLKEEVVDEPPRRRGDRHRNLAGYHARAHVKPLDVTYSSHEETCLISFNSDGEVCFISFSRAAGLREVNV